MHAFATPRLPAPIPTTHLRELLAEPGGRRRLLAAIEDRVANAVQLDDQLLLMRASALLDDRRLGELGL